MPSLFTTPIHLGLGAKAEVQPDFTGMEWYADYGARTAADGAEGRLVTLYRFDQSWDSWEMHPAGDEVVICTGGSITLHQELPDGSTRTITLNAGDYAINPPGGLAHRRCRSRSDDAVHHRRYGHRASPALSA